MTDDDLPLDILIEKCIAAKHGDKSFALFHTPAYEANWRPASYLAEIGNPSGYVSLGEVEGEICFEAPTAKEAVKGLLKKIEDGLMAKTLPPIPDTLP
jgi:hypothetical protein